MTDRTTTVDLLQGTLATLILKSLSWGPLHGYGIARWIEQVTDDELLVEEGSLYPALHRLQARDLVLVAVDDLGNQPPRALLQPHRTGARSSCAPRSRAGIDFPWPCRAPCRRGVRPRWYERAAGDAIGASGATRGRRPTTRSRSTSRCASATSASGA